MLYRWAIYEINFSTRIWTLNFSINSRALYRWAIEKIYQVDRFIPESSPLLAFSLNATRERRNSLKIELLLPVTKQRFLKLWLNLIVAIFSFILGFEKLDSKSKLIDAQSISFLEKINRFFLSLICWAFLKNICFILKCSIKSGQNSHDKNYESQRKW